MEKNNNITTTTDIINGLQIYYGMDGDKIVSVAIDDCGVLSDKSFKCNLESCYFKPDTIEANVREYAEKIGREHIICGRWYKASDGQKYFIVKRNGGFFAEDATGSQFRLYTQSCKPAYRVLPKPTVSLADYIKYGDDYVWFAIGDDFITISPKDIIE